MVLGSNCGTVGLVRTGLVQPSCCCVVVLLWSSIIKNKMGNKACNIKKVDKTKVEEAGIKPATCRMRSDHSTPELHPLCLKLPNLYLTYNQLAFFTPTKNKFGELK